jgi:hypothetical protein
MQFPVPQFTDVEDKIIGSLTIKQFGILFGVGVIIFVSYSLTKSILVAIFFFVLFGIPGLGLAFAPFNGRPIYKSIPLLIKSFTAAKVLVFHKEVNIVSNSSNSKQTETVKKEEKSAGQVLTPQDNLKKVQELLRNTAGEEQSLTESRKK